MSKVARLVRVGIGDMDIVKAPDRIRTSGLGSCVGIILFDEVKKIGGMLHIMLPDSSMAKKITMNRAKYADTGIADLYDQITNTGALPYRVQAKIAGGAQMFQFTSSSDMMRIGPRNVEAVKQKLAQLNIPIVAEEVGGKSGRTIEFDPETTQLNIRTVNRGESVI
ncbi:chemotaxis protein CheD [Halobacillus litoralis]|nr:chemotaxis protein CheD [Halobacillus litoralis]